MFRLTLPLCTGLISLSILAACKKETPYYTILPAQESLLIPAPTMPAVKTADVVYYEGDKLPESLYPRPVPLPAPEEPPSTRPTLDRLTSPLRPPFPPQSREDAPTN